MKIPRGLSRISFVLIDATKVPKGVVRHYVYFLVSGREVIYVGRTKNMFLRARNHLRNRDLDFDSILAMHAETEHLCALMEDYWTIRLLPKHNQRVGARSEPARTERMKITEYWWRRRDELFCDFYPRAD